MLIGGYDSTNSKYTGKILELRAGGSGIIDWQEVDAELENARYHHVVIPVPEHITTCQQFTANCETIVEFVSWVIFKYYLVVLRTYFKQINTTYTQFYYAQLNKELINLNCVLKVIF